MSVFKPQVPDPGSLTLPESPSIVHLKNQAADVLKTGAVTTLAGAQYAVARAYGFVSWTALKRELESRTLTGELKQAIDAGNYAAAKLLLKTHPSLHKAKMGYGGSGPLTWVAECRVPRTAPTPERLAFARWLIISGSDVHQGGDGPLMRAALADERIPMMQLLLDHGANVNALWNGNYPIILAPCETLAPESLKWLLNHGADPSLYSQKYGSPLAMVAFTYSRNAADKQRCLEVLAEHKLCLPNTPCMALARGRTDLVEGFLAEDPTLINRCFSQQEIFPPEVGKPEDGLTFVPLEGGTLLHLAAEFEDYKMLEWLLKHGANPNARAGGRTMGHTPLFHTVISVGDKLDVRTRMLLEAGADPQIRADITKQLSDAPEPMIFEGVTPVEFALGYSEQEWVNSAALSALESSASSS